MTYDVVTKGILKYVKLLDGASTEDGVIQAAIRRNWLDHLGEPTHDGRQMMRSFDRLSEIEHNKI